MGTKIAYRGLLLNQGFVLWADTDTLAATCSCEGTEVCIYIQYLHKEVSWRCRVLQLGDPCACYFIATPYTLTRLLLSESIGVILYRCVANPFKSEEDPQVPNNIK